MKSTSTWMILLFISGLSSTFTSPVPIYIIGEALSSCSSSKYSLFSTVFLREINISKSFTQNEDDFSYSKGTINTWIYKICIIW